MYRHHLDNRAKIRNNLNFDIYINTAQKYYDYYRLYCCLESDNNTMDLEWENDQGLIHVVPKYRYIVPGMLSNGQSPYEPKLIVEYLELVPEVVEKHFSAL